jgi:predicted HTH transcriptional regulator
MTSTELKKLIRKGESNLLEFKTHFSNEAIETIAAFSNTRGGTLLVGVSDEGNIPGFHPNTIQKGLAERLVERLVERLAESQKKILTLMQANPNISKKDLAAAVGISTTAIDKNISALKAKGLLKHVGPDKGGHWSLLEAGRGKK